LSDECPTQECDIKFFFATQRVKIFKTLQALARGRNRPLGLRRERLMMIIIF
jgi:hypothetical protein